MLFRGIVATCLLAIPLGSVSALAQAPNAAVPTGPTADARESAPLPTPEQITASIQEVDAATDLDDAKKASIKQLLQQAAVDLDATRKATAEASRFESMIQDAVPLA